MHAQAVFYIPTGRSEDLHLAFRRVAGVPLYLRGILTLASSGMTDFVLIAPAQYRRQIQRAWQKILRRMPQLKLCTIWLDGHRWEEKHFHELEQVTAPHFLWMGTNTLFTPAWVNDCVLPLLAKRKDYIASPQYPMPWAILRAQDLKPMHEVASQVHENLLDHILPVIVSQGFSAKVFTGGREDCFPLYHRADISRGEDFLCEYIRKSATGWTARNINKRISLPISKLLTRLHIRPNTITVVNMLIGLASGIGTGGMTNTSLLIGAILFQTASIIDGCDGEVAKLTFRTSKFGQYIDTLADNSALFSFLIGLVIHQYRVYGSASAIGWGAPLLIGLVCLLGTMIHYLYHHSNSASLVAFEKQFIDSMSRDKHPYIVWFVQHAKYLIKKDFFSMFFLALAIFNVLPLALVFATLAVWIGFILIFYLRIEGRTHA
ncbi:MAG: hypothetical protein COV45_08360 [Deltaproteobacteria bacterium CG11_big_fil_rev_8_21_14_0_20_47_16]|nr:MAG: hypothetical protein COV45_08360 [Deltaproteobacteria bacterium CG11_big_fil_rev_8_21_14_0_20_47_16]